MPHPTLKAAAEEIKAICHKYDLAAMITLQLPGSAEFVREIDPSWSCAKYEDRPEGKSIRIRAMRKDYPSREAHHEAVADTSSMLISFHNQAQREVRDLQNILQMLSRQVPEIQHIITEETEN